MNRKRIIVISALALVLVAALTCVLITVIGKGMAVSGETYEYETSLTQMERVEDIVIDGKNDDADWANIIPYIGKTAKENRDQSKYNIYEAQIQECSAEVYTYFGETGLFIFATTDEPVINLTTLNPFDTTAFDFYIQSQDALTRMNNLFNYAVAANGNMKLRIRTIDPATGSEGWVSQACVGIKTYVSLNKKGYSVESFIPYTTINMEKPKYLQLATALSRKLEDSKEATRIWEMFEFTTGAMNLTNAATFPLFDENGYVEFSKGDNFAFTHNNIIDLSEDKGTNPKVTTLNRSTVTAFLDKEAVKDVYWKTTIKLSDFNYTDDPRVGILLRGEKKDGVYGQVYLLLELDKEYKGEGYKLKNIIVLPGNNKKNDWTKFQRFDITSVINVKQFNLGILKQGNRLSFYLNDVLLCEGSDFEGIQADTKVTCGITSWFVGAEFLNYKMTTDGLNAIKTKMTAGFTADKNYTAIVFDTMTQKKGYIWGYSVKTNNSTVNFNQKVSKDFTVSTTISNLTSYKDAKDSRQGIMLTKDLGNGKYRRMFIALQGEKNEFLKLQVYAFENDDLGDGWKKVTNIYNKGITVCKEAKLTFTVVDGHAILYLNDQYIKDFAMSKYKMDGVGTAGLSSWKGSAKFSENTLTGGSTFAVGENFAPIYNGLVDFSKDKGNAPQITTSDKSTATPFLKKAAVKNVYWETTLTIDSFNNSGDPRTGIVLRGTKNDKGEYSQVYLLLELDKKYTGKGYKIDDVMVLPSRSTGNDWENYQRFNLDSIVTDENFRLAILKEGKTFSFYLNDVLLCVRDDIADFKADTKVTCGVASWYTGVTFTGYKAQTSGLSAIKAAKTQGYVADRHYNNIKYDLMTQTDGYLWGYSTVTNHSTVNVNKAVADEFTMSVKISDLTAYNNASDSRQGIMLTKNLKDGGYRRMFIALQGAGSEFNKVQIYVFDNDKMGDGWSAVKTVINSNITARKEAELTFTVVNDHAIFYLDGTQIKDFAMSDYGMEDVDFAGTSSWKGTAKFSNIALLDESLFKTGENFVPIYNGMIDFSEDYGDTPRITTVNSGTVTPLMKKATEKNVYFETTVLIKDFSNARDPRVGIVLRGEGSTYSQVYLMLELDKNYTGAGYKIKNALMLPSRNSGNDWDHAQKFNMNSVLTAPEFKLAILKQGKTFSFYLNDVLLVERDNLVDFTADTKVKCGVASWYTGVTFSEYKVETEGLNAIKSSKTKGFVADANRGTINFDLMTQNGGYIWSYTTANNQSTININQNVPKNFSVTTTISDVAGYNGATDSRHGIMLTKDLGSGNYRRMFISVAADNQEAGFKKFNVYVLEKDTIDWNKLIYKPQFGNSTSAKLNVQVADGLARIYLNDKFATEIDLEVYGMEEPDYVGLSSWKGGAKFTGTTLTSGSSHAKDIVTNRNVMESAKTINRTATKDIYAQATFTTEAKKPSTWSRVGLRMTNASGNNVDFLLHFGNGNTATPDTPGYMTLTVTSGGTEGSQTYYNNTTTYANFVADRNNYASQGMTLGISKKGANICFYVNGKLLVTKIFSGFGANDAVNVKLYSKATESTFADYGVVDAYLSDVTKSTDTLKLGNASADLYAETTLQIASASTSMWPRVGIRLTNASGNHVDFVFAHQKDGVAKPNEFFHVPITSGSDGTKTAFKSSLTTDLKNAAVLGGVKLAVAKKGDTLYFYLDGTLLGTKKYSGFGASDKVTAYLYSKGTQSTFTDYSVTDKVFVSDSTKSTDTVTVAENVKKIYVETNLKIAATSTSMWTRVGIRLTNASGNHVDFVFAHQKDGVAKPNEFFHVPITSGSDGTKTAYKSALTAEIKNAAVTDGVKLAVEKDGDILKFYLNGQLLGTKQYAGFGADDAVTVKLYSKGTQTTFYDYSTK